MSFPGALGGPGCGPGPERAGCNTSSPGGRAPGGGIVAVVTWKAFRAAVRRCCRRVRRSGGRAAGLPVLRYRAAAAVGTRPGAGDPAAGRRERAGMPAAGPLRSCGRTHILLPSWCAPRRADAHRGHRHRGRGGAGRGGLRADRQGLGVPASTVRGWLRRLRSRAEEMRQDAMYQLGFVGGLAGPPLPEPPGRRWVTRSTPSPPARMLPSPGNEVGPPSDIFSLGAVLAFAATGEARSAPGPQRRCCTAWYIAPPTLTGCRPKRGR